MADDAELQAQAPPTAEGLAHAIEVLEQLAADRGLIEQLTRDQMHRLLRAAERVAVPDRVSREKLRRAIRRREKTELARKKADDERLLAQTGIRSKATPRKFKRPCAPAPFDYDRVHHFYDAMCPDCAELNWTKRNQTADLSGRYALLTGGRVKIGFQAALKLLRAGAHVIVTTRFPRDASQRFLAEEDNSEWNDRLQLYGIDLRHTPSVEALADHLVTTLPRLDFILNNACQTVRRPPGFYAHLIEGEAQPAESLPEAAGPLLERSEYLTT